MLENGTYKRAKTLAFRQVLTTIVFPVRAVKARLLGEETPPPRLTNLPGKWLQCQANGSNVCRVQGGIQVPLAPPLPAPVERTGYDDLRLNAKARLWP